MGKQVAIQTNFTAGVLSPRLLGRIDIGKYKNALEDAVNCIVMPHGGLRKREGSYYVQGTKNKSVARLKKFQFSVSDNFVIEFGNTYIRFFKNRAPVTYDRTITGIANNGSGGIRVTVSAAHNLSGSSQLTITGVLGTVEANGFWGVTVISPTVFDLQGGVYVNAYVSGGTARIIYEVASPYSSTDIYELGFTQSADVLYICHKSYSPRKLSRIADTNWFLSQATFVDGPYLPENTGTTTITASATSGSVTLTSSAAVFEAGHVGALFRLRDASGGLVQRPWQTSTAYSIGDYVKSNSNVYIATTAATSGNNAPFHIQGTFNDGAPGVAWEYVNDGASYVRITAFTDSTHVTADVLDQKLPLNVVTVGTLYWNEGAWSGVRGYPQVVTIFEERATYARTTYQPQTLWLSVTNSFEDMTPGSGTGEIRDDDALNFTISDDRQNTIMWMSAGDDLQIGTSGGEFKLSSSSGQDAISGKNVSVKRQSTHGSAEYVEPVRAGRSVLFLQRSKRKMREMAFDFANANGYVSNDLTVLSENITAGGLTQLDIQEEPDGIIWSTRADGELIGTTYNKEQDVICWTPHRMGGEFNNGKAMVEQVCTIPAPDGQQDDLWLIVRRTINGETIRTIEYLSAPFRPSENVNGQESAFFVDCGLSLLPSNPVATITVSGITGTVNIVADAAVFGSGDVNKIIRMNGGKIRVTAYTDTTHISGLVIRSLDNIDSAASGKWSIGSVFNTVSGLGHLEGQTVKILADGTVRSDAVVSGGAVTFDGPAASIVHVGLGYKASFRTLRVEAGAITGTAQAQQKTLEEVWAYFYETFGISTGSSAADAIAIPFRTANDPMTDFADLFSGYKKLECPLGWGDAGQVYVESYDPLPMTVLTMVMRVSTSA